jgi:membrane associated rhomboid family serine protease
MYNSISNQFVLENSVIPFKRFAFEEKPIFSPEYILAGKEYYRLVTSAFLHSGQHLILNMLSLYAFAESIARRQTRADQKTRYQSLISNHHLLIARYHSHCFHSPSELA